MILMFYHTIRVAEAQDKQSSHARVRPDCLAWPGWPTNENYVFEMSITMRLLDCSSLIAVRFATKRAGYADKAGVIIATSRGEHSTLSTILCRHAERQHKDQLKNGVSVVR